MRKIFTLCALGFAAALSVSAQDVLSDPQLLSGNSHSFIIDRDGHLWGTGDGTRGMLGTGDASSSSKFVQIGTDKWKSVVAASFHSMGLQQDSTLWSWGWNLYGQLAIASSFPNAEVYSPTKTSDAKWIKVSSRATACLGIKADSTLWGWGDCVDGILGVGDDPNRDPEGYGVFDPQQVGSDKWIDCSPGYYTSAGIQKDGSLWAWGDNTRNYVDSTKTYKYTSPIQIGDDKDWVAVQTGVSSYAALKSDGSLWTFGHNDEGQLGRQIDESKYRNTDPIPAKVIDHVAQFSVGDKHVLVIKDDGTLWGWGYNFHGELGNGKSDEGANENTPVQLGGAKWKLIEAGSYHSMGVQDDGSVWVWGSNRDSQLGLGDEDNRYAPVQLASASSSVNAIQTAAKVKVWPSVASDVINISSASDMGSVSVYAANGACVATKSVSGNATTLNVSILPAGAYIVVVNGANNHVAKRFIKK